MRFAKFTFIYAILCVKVYDVIAKPFFNPFNVAVQLEPSDEGGKKLSFVYPKKSNRVTFEFKSETINEHKFDLSGIFSYLGKKIGDKFNFFKQETVATEAPELDFSAEVTDDGNEDNQSWSSTEDSYASSSTTDEGYEYTPLPDYEHSTPDTDHVYFTNPDYTYEKEAISLIPPFNDYLPPTDFPLQFHLQSE